MSFLRGNYLTPTVVAVAVAAAVVDEVTLLHTPGNSLVPAASEAPFVPSAEPHLQDADSFVPTGLPSQVYRLIQEVHQSVDAEAVHSTTESDNAVVSQENPGVVPRLLEVVALEVVVPSAPEEVPGGAVNHAAARQLVDAGDVDASSVVDLVAYSSFRPTSVSRGRLVLAPPS